MRQEMVLMVFIILSFNFSWSGEEAVKMFLEPLCLNKTAQISDIRAVQKANRKTARKYDGYRRIFQQTSDSELFARLVYAEVLAANCKPSGDELLKFITFTIHNRIQLQSGSVKAVIFKRDQFASSLNMYKQSRYKEFLCPSNKKLFQKILKFVDSLMTGSIKNNFNRRVVNYYLHQHFGSYKENPTAWGQWDKYKVIPQCASFYKKPSQL